MSFIKRLIIGILLGIGCILPGISSGVLCVIFGIYQNLVDSILNIFRNFKKNALYLFPFIIGILIGVFLLGNVLQNLYTEYSSLIKYIFLGLICGTLPTFLKSINNNCNKYIDFKNLLFTLITFSIAVFLIHLEHNIHLNNLHSINFLYLILSGFFMSAGIVIPGVSSTVILMILKIYPTYLNAIAQIDIKVLFPIGIGLILGGIIYLKIINYLLNNYKEQTLYSILGFVIGSIFILFPNTLSMCGIFLFISSFIFSFFINNIKNENSN